ncbi:sel1 repeat family protein [bacterium]|nr:sel1 repeat family protein [bacterium]
MLKNQIVKRSLMLFMAAIVLLSAGGCSEALSYYFYGMGMRSYAKQDYKQAFKFFKASADRGDGRGQYAAAEMLNMGEGTEKNFTAAAAYYEKAIANDNTPADFKLFSKCKLGLLYLTEESVRNSRRGERYLTEAADNDDYIYAQLSLGILYYQGIGTDKDFDKAFVWISKAANAKIEPGCETEKERTFCRAKARFLLGNMYLQGQGTSKAPKKAFKCFQKSADDGNKEAEAMLGYMMVCGEGTVKDRAVGMHMLQKLADKDNPKAKELLEIIKKKNL